MLIIFEACIPSNCRPAFQLGSFGTGRAASQGPRTTEELRMQGCKEVCSVVTESKMHWKGKGDVPEVI